VTEELLGPVAALALSLLVNTLLYTGKVLPRNAVPREDYKQLQDVNASQAEGLRVLTQAVNELITTVRYIQKNGGPGGP
jgi:hypothetical protein